MKPINEIKRNIDGIDLELACLADELAEHHAIDVDAIRDKLAAFEEWLLQDHPDDGWAE